MLNAPYGITNFLKSKKNAAVRTMLNLNANLTYNCSSHCLFLVEITFAVRHALSLSLQINFTLWDIPFETASSRRNRQYLYHDEIRRRSQLQGKPNEIQFLLLQWGKVHKHKYKFVLKEIWQNSSLFGGGGGICLPHPKNGYKGAYFQSPSLFNLAHFFRAAVLSHLFIIWTPGICLSCCCVWLLMECFIIIINIIFLMTPDVCNRE